MLKAISNRFFHNIHVDTVITKQTEKKEREREIYQKKKNQTQDQACSGCTDHPV
jgi:hypothetical protein